MMRKLTAMLMAVLMLGSLLPSGAVAETTIGAYGQTYTVQVNNCTMVKQDTNEAFSPQGGEVKALMDGLRSVTIRQDSANQRFVLDLSSIKLPDGILIRNITHSSLTVTKDADGTYSVGEAIIDTHGNTNAGDDTVNGSFQIELETTLTSYKVVALIMGTDGAYPTYDDNTVTGVTDSGTRKYVYVETCSAYVGEKLPQIDNSYYEKILNDASKRYTFPNGSVAGPGLIRKGYTGDNGFKYPSIGNSTLAYLNASEDQYVTGSGTAIQMQFERKQYLCSVTFQCSLNRDSSNQKEYYAYWNTLAEGNSFSWLLQVLDSDTIANANTWFCNTYHYSKLYYYEETVSIDLVKLFGYVHNANLTETSSYGHAVVYMSSVNAPYYQQNDCEIWNTNMSSGSDTRTFNFTMPSQDASIVAENYYPGGFNIPEFDPTFITHEIKLKKTFTDGSLTDGQFTFELLRDGALIATATNSADGSVTFSIPYDMKTLKTGDYSVKDGKPTWGFDYTVREVTGTDSQILYDTTTKSLHVDVVMNDVTEGNLGSPRVTATTAFTPADDDTFTNIKMQTISVTVNKGFDLNDGVSVEYATSQIPDSVTMQLYAYSENGALNTNKAAQLTPIRVQTLTAANKITSTPSGHGDQQFLWWSYTFENLPKYDAQGRLIRYYVYEVPTPGTTSWAQFYDPGGFGNWLGQTPVSGSDGTLCIHNCFYVNNKTFTLTIKKEWDDNGNDDGVRPTSITVDVYNGNDKYGTYTLAQGSQTGDVWTWTIENIPASVNVNGLSVRESSISGYTLSSNVYDSGALHTATLTNKHAQSTVNLTVSKSWDDDNDVDQQRPTSIRVQLVRNSAPVSEADGGIVTLNAANNWSSGWNALPKNAGGAAIAYSVVELDTPTGYTAEYSQTDGSFAISGDAGAVTITNRHTPNQYVFTVRYEDENGNRIPESVVATHTQTALKNGASIARYDVVVPTGYQVQNVAEDTSEFATAPTAAGFLKYQTPNTYVGAYFEGSIPGRNVTYVVTLTKIPHTFVIKYMADGAELTSQRVSVSKTSGDEISYSLATAPDGYELSTTNPVAVETGEAEDINLYKAATERFEGTMPDRDVTLVVTFTHKSVPYIIRYWQDEIKYLADGVTPDTAYRLADLTGSARYGSLLGVGVANENGNVVVDRTAHRPEGYDEGTADATLTLGAAGLTAQDNIYNVVYKKNTYGYIVKYWTYAPNSTGSTLLDTVTGSAELKSKVGVEVTAGEGVTVEPNPAPYPPTGFDSALTTHTYDATLTIKPYTDPANNPNVYNVWYLPTDYTFNVTYEYQAPTGHTATVPTLPDNETQTGLHYTDAVNYALGAIPAGYEFTVDYVPVAAESDPGLYNATLGDFSQNTMPAADVTYRVTVTPISRTFNVQYVYAGTDTPLASLADWITSHNASDTQTPLYIGESIAGFALGDAEHTLPDGYAFDLAGVSVVGANKADFLTDTTFAGTMGTTNVTYTVPIRAIGYTYRLIYRTDDPDAEIGGGKTLENQHVGSQYHESLTPPEGYELRATNGIAETVPGCTAQNTATGKLDVTMPASDLTVTVTFTRKSVDYTIRYWKDSIDNSTSVGAGNNYLGETTAQGLYGKTLGPVSGYDYSYSLTAYRPDETYRALGIVNESPDHKQLALTDNVFNVIYLPRPDVYVTVVIDDPTLKPVIPDIPDVEPGTDYTVDKIPDVPGYTVEITVPDDDPTITPPSGTTDGSVSGPMPEQDVHVTVTYTAIPLTFTVEYAFDAAGGGIAPTQWMTEHRHAQGSTTAATLKVKQAIESYQLNTGDHVIPDGYEITSVAETSAPKDSGLYKDTSSTFEGEMPAHSVSYLVTLKAKPYTLTLRYQYAQGVTGPALPQPEASTLQVGQPISKTLSQTPTGYVVQSVEPDTQGATSYPTNLLNTATAGTVTGTMPAKDVTVTVTYTYGPAAYRVRYWQDQIGATESDTDPYYLGTIKGDPSARVNDLVGQTGTESAQYTFSVQSADTFAPRGTADNMYRTVGTATPTSQRLTAGENVFDVVFAKNPTLTVVVNGYPGTPLDIAGTTYRTPETDYSVAYPTAEGYTTSVASTESAAPYAPTTTPTATGSTTSATMPDRDVTVTITYTPIPYTFTVTYVYDANGTQIAQPELPAEEQQTFIIGGNLTDYTLVDENVGTFPVGFHVTQVNRLEGQSVYDAQTKLFSGSGLAAGDIAYEVIIQPWPHTLTVRYQYEDGTQAYPDQAATYCYAQTVSEALTAAPTGYVVKQQGYGTPNPTQSYTADGQTLTSDAAGLSGSMPNRDATFYVVYTKQPVTYTVRYWKDAMTGRPVKEDKGLDALYGDTVALIDPQAAAQPTHSVQHLVAADMPAGYTTEGSYTSPSGTLTLNADADHNVYNVIYAKDTITYTVIYWQDEIGGNGTELARLTPAGKVGDTVSVADATIGGAAGTTHHQASDTANCPVGYVSPGTGDAELTLTASAAHDVYNVLYVADHYDFTVSYAYEGAADAPADLPGTQLAADEARYGASVSFTNTYAPAGYRIKSVAPVTGFAQDEAAFTVNGNTISGSMPAHDVEYRITLEPAPLTFQVIYSFDPNDANHPTDDPYDADGYTEEQLYIGKTITTYAVQVPAGYYVQSVTRKSGDATLWDAADPERFTGSMGAQDVVYEVALRVIDYTFGVTYQYKSGETGPDLSTLNTPATTQHVGDAISVALQELPEGYEIERLAGTSGTAYDNVLAALTPAATANTTTYTSGVGFGGAMPAASVQWTVTLVPKAVTYTVYYWKDNIDSSTSVGEGNYLGETTVSALYGKTAGPKSGYDYNYPVTAFHPGSAYRNEGAPQAPASRTLALTGNVFHVVYLQRPDVYVVVVIDNGATPPTIPGLSTAPDGTPGFTDVEPGTTYSVTGIPDVPGYEVEISTVGDTPTETLPNAPATGSVVGTMPENDVTITITYKAKALALTVDYMYNGSKQNPMPAAISGMSAESGVVSPLYVTNAAHYDVPAQIVTALNAAGYGIDLSGSQVTAGTDNLSFAASEAGGVYAVDGTMPATDVTYTLNITPLPLTFEVAYHFSDGEALPGATLPDPIGPTPYHVGDPITEAQRGSVVGYVVDSITYNGVATGVDTLYDGAKFSGNMPAENVRYDVYFKRATVTYTVQYWKDQRNAGEPLATYANQTGLYGDTVTAGAVADISGTQKVWAQNEHQPVGYGDGAGDQPLTLSMSGNNVYHITYYINSYAYTVRYWKQQVAFSNGQPDAGYYLGSTAGQGKYGETVGDQTATHPVSYTEFFSTLTGYRSPGVGQSANIPISENPANNVYDVVYSLDEYSFHVRYAYVGAAAQPALPGAQTQTGLHYQSALTAVGVIQPAEEGYYVASVTEVESATSTAAVTTNPANLYAENAGTAAVDGSFTGNMPARDVYYLATYAATPLTFDVRYEYEGQAVTPTLPSDYRQPSGSLPTLYKGSEIARYVLGSIPEGYEVESVTEVASPTDDTPVTANLAGLYAENTATAAMDGEFAGAMPAHSVSYLVKVVPTKYSFTVTYRYSDKTTTDGLPANISLQGLYVGQEVQSAYSGAPAYIPLGVAPTGYEITDVTCAPDAQKALLYTANTGFAGTMPAGDVAFVVTLGPKAQTYIVRYWQDAKDTGTLLYETAAQSGRYGDTVGTSVSAVPTSTHHTVSNTDYCPTGYVSPGTGDPTLTLGVNNAANVYNVVYQKDTFVYTVHYWTDAVSYLPDGTVNTSAANLLETKTDSAVFGQTLDFQNADILLAQASAVPTGYQTVGRKAEPTGAWKITADAAKNIFHVVYDPESYSFHVRYAYEGPDDAKPRTDPAGNDQTGLRYGGVLGATPITDYTVTGIPAGYELKRVTEVVSATDATALTASLAGMYRDATQTFTGSMPARDVYYLVTYGPKALAFTVQYTYSSTLAPAPDPMPSDYAEPAPGSAASLYTGKAITEYHLADIPDGYRVESVTTSDGVTFYDSAKQTFNGRMPTTDVLYTVTLVPMEYALDVVYQYKPGMAGAEDISLWNTQAAPRYFHQSVNQAVHAAPTGYRLSGITAYASPYTAASAPENVSTLAATETAITGTMPARSLTYVVEFELETVPYAIYYWTDAVSYVTGTAQPDLAAGNLLGSVQGESKYGYVILDKTDKNYDPSKVSNLPLDRELFISDAQRVSYRVPGSADPTRLTLGANGMTRADNVIHVVYTRKPKVTVTVRVDDTEVPAPYTPAVTSPGYVDVDTPYTVVVPDMTGYTPTATTTDDPGTISLPGGIHQDKMPDHDVDIQIVYTPNQYDYIIRYYLREPGKADQQLGGDVTGKATFGTTLGDRSVNAAVTLPVDMTLNATSHCVTPGTAEPGYITIGTGSNVLNVIYAPKPTLTVITKYTDGGKPDDTKTYPDRTPGDPYHVTAPDVKGYTPSITVTGDTPTVTAGDVTGVMPGTDVTVTILYTPNNYAYRVEYYELDQGVRTLLNAYDGTAPYGTAVGTAAAVDAAYRVDPYAAAQPRHRSPYFSYSGDIVISDQAASNLLVIVYVLKPDVIVRVTMTDGSTPPVIPGVPSVNPGDPFDVNIPDVNGYTHTVTVSSTDTAFTTKEYTIRPDGVTGVMPGEDVVINVEYSLRTDLSYRVEYYYNGVQDVGAAYTMTNVTFGTRVTYVASKPRTGYRQQRVDNLPLQVSTVVENNVVRVYYVSVIAPVIEDAEIPLGAGTAALNAGDCAE